jgi:hypothetical protein
MARQALKQSQDAKDVDRRFGAKGVPDPGGMNLSAYPHEIGPNQFLWLINARRAGNSIRPRGGQSPVLQTTYPDMLSQGASSMHPWSTHEGAPFRLYFASSG